MANSPQEKHLEKVVTSNMVNCLIELNKLDEAFSCMLLFISRHPKNVPALAKMGYIKYLQGQYKSALDFYKIALKRDPTNIDLLNNAAVLLRLLGNFEMSKKFCDKILSTAGYSHASNLTNTMLLSLSMGMLSDAHAMCELIYENEPFNTSNLVDFACNSWACGLCWGEN